MCTTLEGLAGLPLERAGSVGIRKLNHEQPSTLPC